MRRCSWVFVGACTFHAPASVDPPPVHCGDGVLDSDEMCDDANVGDGDGCDHACAIEPAFTCPMPAQPCVAVTGLGWTTGATLPAIGGTGGTPFMHDCPAGTSVVGVDGYSTNDNKHLGQTRAHCAASGFRSDGRLQWTAPTPTQPQGNDMLPPNIVAECNDDELAVGFVASSKTDMAAFVAGFQLVCRPVAFLGGVLVEGPVRMLATIGPAIDPIQPPTVCADGTFAASFIGRSGAAIDQMTFRCDTATPILE